MADSRRREYGSQTYRPPTHRPETPPGPRYEFHSSTHDRNRSRSRSHNHDSYSRHPRVEISPSRESRPASYRDDWRQPHRAPLPRPETPPGPRYRFRSSPDNRKRSRSRSPNHDSRSLHHGRKRSRSRYRVHHSHGLHPGGVIPPSGEPMPSFQDPIPPSGYALPHSRARQEPAFFSASPFPVQGVILGLSSASLRVNDYCDPNLVQQLRFPFLGKTPNDRFALDSQGRFSFYGRHQFREIYNVAQSLTYQGTSMYYLHGTLGSGKSHILAALTCLLMKEGHRVVYIPDCRALLLDLFGYLQFALVLAYCAPSDKVAREYLEDCKTIEELTTFCVKASSDHRLLFIVDQANVLDPEDESADRITLASKRDARSLLDRITARHLKLASATANYAHGIADQLRQTGERRLHMYGGLTEEEMHYWWRNTGLGTRLSQEERLGIEDVTGKLPILLNVLDKLPIQANDQGGLEEMQDLFQHLLGGLSQSREVLLMRRRILHFGECQKEKYKDSTNITRFRDAWHACIVGGRVTMNMEQYLDWRHFYVHDGDGGVTCGVVRRAATDFLRSFGNPEDFLRPQWSHSLRLAGGNVCMLGFVVEQMVLSWMALRGCGFIERRFGERPTTMLVDAIPKDVLKGQSGVVLYIPTVYNFPAVDAVLVQTGPENTAAIYGIQVTISQTHSNSEEMFFRKWESWLDQLGLPHEKVHFGFVWVLEDRGFRPARENVPEKVVTLRGDRKLVYPAFERHRFTVGEVDKEIGSKLAGARARVRRL